MRRQSCNTSKKARFFYQSKEPIFFILVTILVVCSVIPKQSFATAMAAGTSQFKWDSLTISTDSSLSLEWNQKGTFLASTIEGYNSFYGHSPTGTNHWENSSSSTSLLSISQSKSTISAIGSQTSLGFQYLFEADYVEDIHNNDDISDWRAMAIGTDSLAVRDGSFTTSGSGNMTVSIDYHYSFLLSTDYAGEIAFASPDFYLGLSSPASQSTQKRDYRFQVEGGDSLMAVGSGTLTVSGYFNDKQTGILDFRTGYNSVAGATAYNVLNNPEPIPEPTTVVLLGSGLIGLFFFNCRKRGRDKYQA